MQSDHAKRSTLSQSRRYPLNLSAQTCSDPFAVCGALQTLNHAYRHPPIWIHFLQWWKTFRLFLSFVFSSVRHQIPQECTQEIQFQWSDRKNTRRFLETEKELVVQKFAGYPDQARVSENQKTTRKRYRFGTVAVARWLRVLKVGWRTKTIQWSDFGKFLRMECLWVRACGCMWLTSGFIKMWTSRIATILHNTTTCRC